MMSRNLILAIGILCIPFIYLALSWGSMPDQVALHFGADGQPDRYGHKSELFIALGIISAVGLLAFGLIQWLPTIDPKKNLETSSTTLFKIGFSLVVFMAILNIYIIYSATHATEGRLVFVLLGAFFAVLGNLLHSVKPNYFVGMRLPWTLESEANWRATHQFASRIWFGGGIAIAIFSLLLPLKWVVGVFLVSVILLTVVPAVYSYRYFKQNG
ncbi:MAG: SdpI family protein [Saprospiraceae bacterium]|nr:SdpI family protein [Saprospiraceae bacterium]MBK9686478.1 SdpI family protein [Saprospiraceae bacterium]